MWASIWTSAIAVVGTLGGAALAGWVQHHSAARRERAALAEQLRRERQEAVKALITALTAHRRTLYTRWKLRIQGAAREEREAARWESWSTRSRVSDARVALRMVTSDTALLGAADRAIDRSFALSAVDETTTQAVMDQRGQQARTAHDALVAVAATAINGI